MKSIKLSGEIGIDEEEGIMLTNCSDKSYRDLLSSKIAYLLLDNEMVDFTREHSEGEECWYDADMLSNVTFKYKIQDCEEKTIKGTLEIVVENYGYSEWTIMGSTTTKFLMDREDLEELFKLNVGKNIEISIEKEVEE